MVGINWKCLSDRGASNEYPQHVLWRYKKILSQNFHQIFLLNKSALTDKETNNSAPGSEEEGENIIPEHDIIYEVI